MIFSTSAASLPMLPEGLGIGYPMLGRVTIDEYHLPYSRGFDHFDVERACPTSVGVRKSTQRRGLGYKPMVAITRRY